MPEAGVQQVQHGMLGAADIQVNGHPALFRVRGDKGPVVRGIQIPQVIPARPGPLGHGVRLAAAGTVALGTGCLDPLAGVGQRRLAAWRRAIVLQLR